MANVTFHNGQFYTTSPLGSALSIAGNNTFFGNPAFMDGYIKLGLIKPIGAPTMGNTQQASSQRAAFTPNAATQAQLQGLGAAPQWMFDAYTNKIQSMGGNANPAVPFQVTPSGFPGMGGKTAPTGGQ